jgi:eukaryotic-like serine/threonine-protein kinase
MGDPQEEATAPLDESAYPPTPGRLPYERVGTYRLIRVLGSGGMGEVFLAERDDASFRQEVAIKLVPFALADSERAGRLRRERQILAQLDHPNLVRVLDGGVAPDGTPYIAMEYVRGRSLRAWVKERHPGLNARLQHFLELCSAVSYAHQRLIVHRDIKPGNIMVDEHDHARLLDFGIAKLLAPDQTDPNLTSTGMAPATAAYSAPEQVMGTATTTATDIYQLGLVLYELLTGNMAQPVSHTSRASEVERFVCRSEPTPPSRIDPGEHGVRLPARVARDFDTVVATALQKQPERRYRSAEALADDIRRILAREPILARRDSVLYRARRFVERHAVATTAAVLLLVSVTGFALHERSLRAEAERLLIDRDQALAQARAAQARSESVQRFLVDMISGAAASQKGHELRVTDVLDTAQEGLQQRLADDPDTSLAVVDTLAGVRLSLGQNAKASSLLESAIPALEKAVGEDDPRLLDLLRRHVFAADAMADYSLKLELAERRYARLLRSQGEKSPITLTALSDVGISRYFAHNDQRERAFEEMRRAADQLALVSGEFDPEALMLKRYELQFMYVDGRHRQVIERGQQLYERASAAVGKGDATVMNILGFVMNSASAIGDYERGLALNERLRATLIEHRGEKTPSQINVLNARGAMQLEMGDYDAALKTFEEGLSIAADALGPAHPGVLRARANIVTVSSFLGRHRQAVDQGTALLKQHQEASGPTSVNARQAMVHLAAAQGRAGDVDQAEHWLAQAEPAQEPFDPVMEPWFEQQIALQRTMLRAWQQGPATLDDGFIERARGLLEKENLHRNTIEYLYLDLRALGERHGALPAPIEALRSSLSPAARSRA